MGPGLHNQCATSSKPPQSVQEWACAPSTAGWNPCAGTIRGKKEKLFLLDPLAKGMREV